MNKESIMQILADEVFQIDIRDFNENTNLESIANWDSMAVLCLISVYEEYLNKLDIDGVVIKKFKTVKDILDNMNI